MKQTPLKRKKRLNPVSLKRIAQLNLEVPARVSLCQRVGGTPVFGKHTYYIKSKPYPVITVQCLGGVCECGCGERTDGLLEPHEKVFRSHGGKLSLENTIMVKPEHHPKLQNNELHWSNENNESRKIQKKPPCNPFQR